MSAQTAATASLGFGNNNFSLPRSLFGKPFSVNIGGIDFREIMKPSAETLGYQTITHLFEVKRSIYFRRSLPMIRLKNAHSV